MEYLHGGDVYGESPIKLDFSVNLSPFGMPETVRQAVAAQTEIWERYPDSESRALRSALAKYYGKYFGEFWNPELFICGNGASDLLYSLVFALRPGRAVLFSPCFGEYEAALNAVGCQVKRVPLSETEGFSMEGVSPEAVLESDPDWVIMGNPNNPTGLALPAEQVERWADACQKRNCLLVVDECFNFFIPEWEKYSAAELLPRFSNLFLLNAFTKIFSLAGLRLGYGICAGRDILEKIRRCRQPWSVSGAAQAAGVAALTEEEFIKETAGFVEKEREALAAGLRKLGFCVFPSMANFLLFKSGDDRDYYTYCRKKGILLRSCHTFDGLGKGYYRTCVRTGEENGELLRCLAAAKLAE